MNATRHCTNIGPSWPNAHAGSWAGDAGQLFMVQRTEKDKVNGGQLIKRFIADFPDPGEHGWDELVRVAGGIEATGLAVVRRKSCLLPVARCSHLPSRESRGRFGSI